MDQVLVEVHAAGVNPVETYIRSGNYGRLPELPYTPGSDGAGIIRKIGNVANTKLQVGQRVWLSGCITGTYAESALCTAEQIHPLPDRLSFSQGAALGVAYATAYRAIFQRGQGKPGQTVLVHGATGGVGIAAVQLARAAGMHVFATGGTDRGRAVLLDSGAHEALDHTQSDYLDRVAEKTQGRGVDIIVEMLANENLGKDLNVVARGGCIVVVGARGSVEINPRLSMQRECDIRGLMLFNASSAELREANAAVQAGLENGTLNPVVAVEIPLAEAPRAHVAVMAPGHRGKIVLTCRG
jgi:NADPH2:quinone reductase